MKRPFAVIGAVCFITAIGLSDFKISTVSAICFVSLAVFLLSLFVISPKSKHIWVTFLLFAVTAVSLSMLFVMKDFASTSRYDNEKVTFSGTVTKNEYNRTYETLRIKVNSVNGRKENFYINASVSEATGLCEGDRITADAKFRTADITAKLADIKSPLADKVYFTAENLDSITLDGENRYFKAVGKIKNVYKCAVQSYLPNELGAVALGVTVGDRSGIGTHTRNCFNYSGTAHLLVVSGLHLTIWTMFISNFIPVLRRKRFLNAAVSVAFILLYSALTGFSVSVVRAGVMLFIIKLASLLRKDCDSLNSLGISVFLLIAVNPFTVYSVSFLLSAGSTLGLVMFGGKLRAFLYRTRAGRIITKRFIGRIFVDSFAVSISVSVFTLPVFILYFDMFPVLSFISNVFIIDLSTVLMLATVLGVIAHFAHLFSLANCLFCVAGLVTKTVTFIAEKIGMQTFSTIAVPSRYFKLFLVFAFIAWAVVFLLFKKRKKIRNAVLSAVLITGFLLAVFVNMNFEFTYPSVDISASNGGVCVLVRDGYDCVFFGTERLNADYVAGSMLERHNLKAIGCLYIADTNAYTFGEIKKVTDDYPVNSFAFGERAEPLLDCSKYCENLSSVTVNGRISVRALSPESAVISNGIQDIFVSADISCQKLLEIGGKYDIIILSSDAFALYGGEMKAYLKNDSSQIITLDGGDIIIYPDIGQIYHSESF